MVEHELSVWVCDGLIKVFADTDPPSTPVQHVRLAGAAGECEVAQIAVRAPNEDLALGLPAVSPLGMNGERIAADRVTCRFVDLVPVPHATQGVPRTHLIRTAPGFFPDPLCLESVMVVPAGQTRSIWVSVSIPRDAAAGQYVGQITLEAGGRTRALPLTVTVWPIQLPEKIPFSLTLWVWPGLLAKYHGVKLYGEEFWRIILLYADEMAAHRQDTIFTPIVGADSLIRVERGADGGYGFDFAHFDRWVALFLEAGFTYIEGGHFCDHGMRPTRVFDRAQNAEVMVPGASKVERLWENGEYLGLVTALVPALRDHLRQRGWDTIYRQHLYDEPSTEQAPHYLKLAQHVRALWPQVTIVEAADSTPALFDAIDIAVPLADRLEACQKILQSLPAQKQLWTYTCNHPRGRFPNVYLDQPLVMTRVLFWIMWKYGVRGFLYYALGYWQVQHAVRKVGFDPYAGEQHDPLVLYDPWIDPCQNATWQVPPGSWGFVYPPREPCSLDPRVLSPRLVENFTRVRQGQPSNKADEAPIAPMMQPIDGVVSSIRWEQLREGIEDYGLLCLAREAIDGLREASANEPAANAAADRLDAIVASVARDWNDYSLDPADIRTAREAAAKLICEVRQRLS